MAKGWYVVHTYSGYENKVQKHINKLIEDGTLSEYVFNAKVPAEEVVEVRDGKRRVSSKKFLPGYIMVDKRVSIEDEFGFDRSRILLPFYYFHYVTSQGELASSGNRLLFADFQPGLLILMRI